MGSIYGSGGRYLSDELRLFTGLGQGLCADEQFSFGCSDKNCVNVCADVCVGARNPRSGDRYSGRFWLCGLCNVWMVSKFIGADWFSAKRHLLKPAISAAVMAIAVIIGYHLCSALGNSLATAVSIALGGVVYFVILLILGGITVEEVAALPKIGPHAAKIMVKILKKS